MQSLEELGSSYVITYLDPISRSAEIAFSESSQLFIEYMTSNQVNVQARFPELIAVAKQKTILDDLHNTKQNGVALKIPQKSRDLKKVLRAALGKLCGEFLYQNY